MKHAIWRSTALAFALGLGASGAAQAQMAAEVLPGSPLVRGDRLGTGRWRVQYARVQEGKEQLMNPYYWDVAKTTWNGRPALVSVQWSDAPDGGTDSTFVDPVTLATLAYRAHNPRAIESADYTAASVHFIHDGKTGRVERETPLDTRAFDGSVRDLVVGALPLAPGYAARVPILRLNHQDASAAIEFMDVRVTGEDVRPHGVVWLVSVSSPHGESAVEVDQNTRAITAASMKMSGMDMRMTRVPAGK